MAQQNVCDFFKFGFCKFKSTCRKHHEVEKCTKDVCDIKSCRFRHPRVCRYFRDIGFCKFSEWCLFKHDGILKGKNDIEEISEKIRNIEKVIEEKTVLIESLQKLIDESQEIKNTEAIEQLANDMENKFETFETNFVTMKKCLAEKDSYIVNLENKVKDMDSNFEAQNLKIKNLENSNQEIMKELAKFKENMSNNDNLAEVETEEKFKCDKCDFESNSKHGLKVHITRKHTNMTKEKYPRKCDLCEKKFLNHTEMKRHMKTHSYKEAKFKCEDCEFVGEKFETMEVHLGKFHTDSFECGLCERSFGNIEILETHLNTCEIYRCRKCYHKETNISNIKAHAEKKHPGLQATLIFHLKMKRNDKNEVSSTEHWHTNL